jgi:Uma2 family endonuclease
MVLEIKIPASEVELNFPNGLSHQDFEALCFANKELLIEREPNGKIKIMSPMSPYSSNNEAEFIADLKLYTRAHGGKAYSSQVGFLLPDNSVRMPDACYVSQKQIARYSSEDLKHIVLIVPEFVVEVLSPTDSLKELHTKMSEQWIANGVLLGWLVDAANEKLWIYRKNGTVDLIEGFEQSVSGEDVVPGFKFDLRNLT